MSEEISFTEYAVEGVGTVIAHEAGSYIVRTSDGRVVGWLAQGDPSQENAAVDIAEAIANPPLPPPPQTISRAQFIIAARRVLGITEADVFALISTLPAGEVQETARDLWEHARDFNRNNSLLNGLAAVHQPPLTQEQLDAVFRAGSALDLD